MSVVGGVNTAAGTAANIQIRAGTSATAGNSGTLFLSAYGNTDAKGALARLSGVDGSVSITSTSTGSGTPTMVLQSGANLNAFAATSVSLTSTGDSVYVGSTFTGGGVSIQSGTNGNVYSAAKGTGSAYLLSGAVTAQSAAAGTVSIIGGDAKFAGLAAGNKGGSVYIQSGDGGPLTNDQSSTGGSISLVAFSDSLTLVNQGQKTGGGIFLKAADSGSGLAGSVTLIAGKSTSGTRGSIILSDGASSLVATSGVVSVTGGFLASQYIVATSLTVANGGLSVSGGTGTYFNGGMYVTGSTSLSSTLFVSSGGASIAGGAGGGFSFVGSGTNPVALILQAKCLLHQAVWLPPAMS